MRQILYVGRDIDDKNFHCIGLCDETGELFEFKSKPTKASLLCKIRKLKKKGFDLKVCYDATYIGFNLLRELDKEGIECRVLVSSLIPERARDRVKIDYLDSLKLAKYFLKGLLTPVYVPDSKGEEVRDFIRSRSFLVNQRSALKRHILSACRRYDLNYKSDGKSKHYWTQAHMDWLSTQLKNLDQTVQDNMKLLVNQYYSLSQTISQYDDEIELFASKRFIRARR